MRQRLAVEELAIVLDVSPRHAYDLIRNARRDRGDVIAGLVAAPARPLPPVLRGRVLDAVRGRPVGDRRLFPRSGYQPRRAGAAAVAVAAVLVVALVAVVVRRDDPATPAAEPVTSSSSTASTTTTAPATTTTTVAVETTTTPPPPAPGSITTGTPVVSLGASDSQGTIDVRNSGGQPLSFTATTAAGPLVLAPDSGTIEPGAAVSITVTLDRAAAPEGSFRRVVAFAAAEAGGLGVTVTAEVEHPPVVTDLAADPAALKTGDCGSNRATVSAIVSDESELLAVSLVWGQTGSVPSQTVEMSRGAGASYIGIVGPVPDPGELRWSVIARDVRGNSTVTPVQAIPVSKLLTTSRRGRAASLKDVLAVVASDDARRASGSMRTESVDAVATRSPSSQTVAPGRARTAPRPTRRTAMRGWGTWSPSRSRPPGLQPVAERHRRGDVDESSSPSPGWARGATSQRPRNWAFMAATTRPRHHDRRATRWATNQCSRPSTSTAPRSTGTRSASRIASRASSPVPPSVRHRSPPSSPSGGSGVARPPGRRRPPPAASASVRTTDTVGRQRPVAHPTPRPSRSSSVTASTGASSSPTTVDDAATTPAEQRVGGLAGGAGGSPAPGRRRPSWRSRSISCLMLRTKSPPDSSSSSSTSSRLSPAAHAWASAQKPGRAGG